MSNNYLRHCSHDGKTIRVTISLEREIQEKIRMLHSLMSTYGDEDWSISKVINMLLLGGIIASEKLSMQEWDVIKKFASGKPLSLDEIRVENYVRNLVALRQIV